MKITTSGLIRGGLAAFSCLSAFAAEAGAQFTKADSGWVRLFNGTNFDGFYSRDYGNVQPMRPPASSYAIQFAGTDTAAIRVTATTPGGNIGTDDTTFSHYRLRWESKYDAINANSNSGLSYHGDEKKIRMQNNWLRAVEFQGKQSEIGSAFSAQQVTFNTRSNGTSEGSNYSASGANNLNVCEIGCNGVRWVKGNPLILPYAGASPTVPRWLRFLLIARGSDSAIHIVNDTTVMRLWNIRIFNDSTKKTGGTTVSGGATQSNMTPNGPYDHGSLGWQAEGAAVNYRRLEVMKFPPSTPMNEHYLHRLFLDAPAAAILPSPSSQITLTWRKIGTIPKVKVEYRVGSGSWITAADSVPDTGSYVWTAPGSVPDSVNFRISSLAYVWADSTAGGSPVSIYNIVRSSKGPLFIVRNGELLIPDAQSFDRAEIRDASGKSVRSLPGGRAAQASVIRWDLADSRGAKVRPGLYFITLTGARETQHARVRVD